MFEIFVRLCLVRFRQVLGNCVRHAAYIGFACRTFFGGAKGRTAVFEIFVRLCFGAISSDSQ